MRKTILFAIMICLTFSLAFGSLQFGQTGGKLNFEEIYVGESKTLQYAIINPNNQSIQFKMIYPENLIVSPENGTIRANGQQEINVTVIGNETGTFEGRIRARLSSAEGEEKQGAIYFQLEVEKDFSYEVIENPQEENNNLLLYVLLAIIVTFLILGIYFYIRKRR